MRLTEFWERMRRHLGPSYAESFARDQVIAGLGGRTVYQALAEGQSVKAVWRAVCEALDLPASER